MRRQVEFVMRDFEGAMSYEAMMSMTDLERAWWVERSVEHQEAIEEEMEKA